MTREEIITRWREESPEITDRVVSDTVAGRWCEVGNMETCTRARLITGSTTFTADVDESSYDLTVRISKFYDIDEYPGGGVCYNNDRIDQKTKAWLDEHKSSWRTASSGTPKWYFRRGATITFDKAPDTANDIDVDAILIPDPLDDDAKIPFNGLSHLEPFHYSLVLYLTMRAKSKVGKPADAENARKEYEAYIAWIKRELGGGKYSAIEFSAPHRL